MKFLLDTHTFLWYINGDAKLSANAKISIANPYSIKFISIASLWEIAIKINLGKLKIDMPFNELSKHLVINSIEILPITFEHTEKLLSLEPIHKDPFDRIIIAQSITENLIVISKDTNFGSYKELKLLW